MRFQGLAVVIGKNRWPELVARQRKKDGGLDAYAPASLTAEGFGKGLAASITATRRKVLDDAKTAKRNFPDLKALLFVTAGKVGNSASKKWREEVRDRHGLDLHVIEREEIVALLSMPENAPLGTTFLGLRGAVEPDVEDLVAKARRAGAAAVQGWLERARAARAPQVFAGLHEGVRSSVFVAQFEGEGHGCELGIAVPQELRTGGVACASQATRRGVRAVEPPRPGVGVGRGCASVRRWRARAAQCRRIAPRRAARAPRAEPHHQTGCAQAMTILMAMARSRRSALWCCNSSTLHPDLRMRK